MELSFKDKEDSCRIWYESLGQVYHVCSQENFEIIFTSREDYVAGIGILGICCKLFPKVHVYTFEYMSNHIHLVMSGLESEIEELLKLLKSRLKKYFESLDRIVPLGKMQFKLHPVQGVDYFRAAVAYVNRNGFVARSDCSPYTYPWGANSSYFNPTMRRYYDSCRENLTVHEIRTLLHSKAGDAIKDLYELDGCVSPLSFCHIDDAEKVFRDEKQYFYYVARNVESYSKIAKEIGEMISLTDDDIFQIISKRSFEICGSRNPSLLDANSKMDIARQLHYQYNASNKQIQRMLKIDSSVLDVMF